MDMSKYMNKAQVSIEFILVFSILLVIFTAIMTLEGYYINKISKTNMHIELKDLCDEISDRINSAVIIGDGFYSEIYLADNIQVEVVNKTLYCKYKNQIVAERVFIDNISGFLNQGRNIIKNVGGLITIEG